MQDLQTRFNSEDPSLLCRARVMASPAVIITLVISKFPRKAFGSSFSVSRMHSADASRECGFGANVYSHASSRRHCGPPGNILSHYEEPRGWSPMLAGYLGKKKIKIVQNAIDMFIASKGRVVDVVLPCRVITYSLKK